jgi:ABC-2 type transport system permease protein
MSRLIETALVIARRDFTATVASRSFLLFLLAPIAALVFALFVSLTSKQSDQEATQLTVAIVSDSRTSETVREARTSMADIVGTMALPEFRTIDPEADVDGQIKRLLASPEQRIAAVLAGDLDRPVLIAPERMIESLEGGVSLIIADARRRDALLEAGIPVPGEELTTRASEESAGSLNRTRYFVARVGQVAIMMLTLLLATMALSSLVEEKSSKVIEVLAASVPLDAIFLGKLIAMLGISAVGIGVWGSLAGAGIYLLRDLLGAIGDPAVGWPLFAILTVFYFVANYMLLGILFLSIGGRANSIREIQTLSLPATFAQLGVFALAGAAVGMERDAMFWVATVFPLSSPLAMIAVAAQSGAVWPHLLALAWQALWVAIMIRLSARWFRRAVFKSVAADEPLFRLRRG